MTREREPSGTIVEQACLLYWQDYENVKHYGVYTTIPAARDASALPAGLEWMQDFYGQWFAEGLDGKGEYHIEPIWLYRS